MIPTRRCAALFALIAPIWLVSTTRGGLTAAIVVTALALFVFVLDAIALPNAGKLRVSRALPASIGLGDAAQGSYEVQSRWPLRLHLELHDALVPAVERTTPPVDADAPWRLGALTLPARVSAELPVELVGRVRGEHELGVVVVRVRGPLGLAQRS